MLAVWHPYTGHQESLPHHDTKKLAVGVKWATTETPVQGSDLPWKEPGRGLELPSFNLAALGAKVDPKNLGATVETLAEDLKVGLVVVDTFLFHSWNPCSLGALTVLRWTPKTSCCRKNMHWWGFNR